MKNNIFIATVVVLMLLSSAMVFAAGTHTISELDEVNFVAAEWINKVNVVLGFNSGLGIYGSPLYLWDGAYIAALGGTGNVIVNDNLDVFGGGLLVCDWPGQCPQPEVGNILVSGQVIGAGGLCTGIGNCITSWDQVGGGGGAWSESGGNVYRETGYVGIGTNTPEAKLDVYNGDIIANRLCSYNTDYCLYKDQDDNMVLQLG